MRQSGDAAVGSPNEKIAELSVKSNDPLLSVAQAVERLRYGVIQLTVHDGKLIQLETTEKLRFT